MHPPRAPASPAHLESNPTSPRGNLSLWSPGLRRKLPEGPHRQACRPGGRCAQDGGWFTGGCSGLTRGIGGHSPRHPFSPEPAGRAAGEQTVPSGVPALGALSLSCHLSHTHPALPTPHVPFSRPCTYCPSVCLSSSPDPEAPPSGKKEKPRTWKLGIQGTRSQMFVGGARASVS